MTRTTESHASSRVQATPSAWPDSWREAELARALLDALPLEVTVYDAAGRAVRRNGAAAAFWQRAGGVVPQTVQEESERIDASSREGRPVPPGEWPPRVAIEHGRTIDDAILRVAGRGEEGRWTEVTAHPLREHGSASPVGWLVTMRDASLEWSVIDELRSSEERLASVVGLAKDAILAIDDEGRVLLANEAAATLFAAVQPPLVGGDIARCLPDLGPALASAPVHQPLEGQFVVAAGGGDTGRVVDLSMSRRIQDGVAMRILILRDVTERQQVRDRADALQRLEAVGLLAGGVAHDFNNLLTVIDGTLSLMRLRGGETPEAREDVDTALTASRRAAVLTRQLLAFSRQQVLQPRPLRINDSVREVFAYLTRLLGEQVDVELQLGPDLGEVVVDPGQLEQVLVNLVLNARDAMPSGGRLRVATRVRSLTAPEGDATSPPLAAGDYIELAVEDTGTGMPPEVQARIFEPFFTTKGMGKGTGLGLATSYGIIRQSGGAMAVRSEVGKGTVMTVLLPRAAQGGGEEAGAEGEGAATLAGTLVPGSRILLVEDESDVRATIARMLRGAGYAVSEATDGVHALELWFQRPQGYALVLSDARLPRLGGLELRDTLRAHGARLPFILMSGYLETLESAGLPPDVPFLYKPIRSRELLVAVQGALAGRRTA